MRFRTKLVLGYGSILAITTLMSGIVYYELKKLIEVSRWLDHTYEVIRTAEHSMGFLIDMETGMRGYLVTGSKEFLEPFEAGKNAIEAEIQMGKELTTDNPVQGPRWAKLETFKDKWLKTVAEPEIEIREEVQRGQLAWAELRKLSSRGVGRKILVEVWKTLDILHGKIDGSKNAMDSEIIHDLTFDLFNQEAGFKEFLLTGDEESLDRYIRGIEKFALHFDEFTGMDYRSAGIRDDEIGHFKDLVLQWQQKVAIPEMSARRKVNQHPKTIESVSKALKTAQGKQLMDKMREVIGEIVLEEERLLSHRSMESEKRSVMTIMSTVFGSLIAIFMGGFIAFFTVKTLMGQLGHEPNTLAEITSKVSLGILENDDRELSSLTGVYASVQKMITTMKSVTSQVNTISQGNYKTTLEPLSDKDELGHALLKMTEQLKQTTEENELNTRQKTGQNNLNQLLGRINTIERVCDTTLTFLVRYLDAHVAAFFLLNEDGVLELKTSYAYQRRKTLSNCYGIGDGLVGQAAKEKKPIIITEMPDDYVHITSGLGSSSPASILVYPILYRDQFLGVIEIGSFHLFDDHDLGFLDLIAESVATALYSAKSSQKMKALLTKTQEQAKNLKHQQEELKEANLSLEKQKTELMESESLLQHQQEELRQTNEELEEQTEILEEQKNAIQEQNLEIEHNRKLIEEKARDLELTSKYKTEFLANMSHELRTPLNSILLLSKLLSENKEDNLTPRQQEYSQTIHLSGSELLDLINEILDLSKVESGKMDLNVERVKIQELGSRLDRDFRPHAQDKNLFFRIDYGPDIPSYIQTDHQRLVQILKNFISNALKFTSNGGITISIKRLGNENIKDTGLDPKRTLVFSCKDTGIGIPIDKQNQLFEPFHQGDGTTSRKYGGSGLGLSISRELTKLLGGVIQVISEAGKGSEFRILLPETPDEPVSEPPDPEPGTSQTERPGKKPDPEVGFIPDDRNNLEKGDKSILIIENDPRFAKILCDLSRENGFKVLIAGDGETGLHFAEYYKPDAIILDIELPGMDGWSVMTRLKEGASTRHIPVHFISASDRHIEARKMGAVGFLTKPVSISMLNDAFEKIEYVISRDIKEVLVVEDDPRQRKAILELIGNGNVHITEAKTGGEALEAVKSRVYDCIILDIGLPDMTGVELLTRLSELIQEMPVIVYTGKDLTRKELALINEYTEKTIIKGVKSAERLVDETALFLHQVEANLPAFKRKMIRLLHDRESVFEGKKILVVDDDMRNVYAISSVLEETGMEIIEAKNGLIGVRMVGENPDIDLVLMDIMMPEMDGYEAIVKIREDSRNKNLPIIALTAKAMRGDRQKCIEAGANDYLAKPVNTEKLLSMMRVWLY